MLYLLLFSGIRWIHWDVPHLEAMLEDEEPEQETGRVARA